MKKIIGIIIVISCFSALAQDTTYTYAGWERLSLANFVPKDSISDVPFTEVDFQGENPVQFQYFNADGRLEKVVKNEFDEQGNHISSQRFDAKGRLRESNLYRNNPEELAQLRTVFGVTFIPENSNFTIHREYNEQGRETAYQIFGVQGNRLYSRQTSYREDGRKEREVLRDDLNDILIAERRYQYNDKEKRTILEEFNNEGKLVQKVILFNQHDIIEE